MIFLWCFIFLTNAVEAPAAVERWWEKPSLQKKVRQERQVIVSVKRDPAKTKHDYVMTGVGVVKATLPFTIERILDFSSLQKVSSYFKKIHHQPEFNRVYFILEAYGYEARMLIKYSVETSGNQRIFHWRVVWGGFQGMIGSIDVSSLEAEKTQLVMHSNFDDKEIPLPSIFTSFVLEILVQQVSKSMREFIEDAYKAKVTKVEGNV